MRKWVVGFLAVALLLFGGLFTLVRPMACPVDRATFERVKEGMTQEEVHAILGGPPGDYRTRPVRPRFKVANVETWQGDDGDIHVCFERGTVVIPPLFVESQPGSLGLLELARWRLGRLKERLLP